MAAAGIASGLATDAAEKNQGKSPPSRVSKHYGKKAGAKSQKKVGDSGKKLKSVATSQPPPIPKLLDTVVAGGNVKATSDESQEKAAEEAAAHHEENPMDSQKPTSRESNHQERSLILDEE